MNIRAFFSVLGFFTLVAIPAMSAFGFGGPLNNKSDVNDMIDLTRPLTVDIRTKDLYAAKGFDSNDTVEVVATGYLPNLCYQSPFAEVKKEGNTFEIKLKALLYPSNIFCPQVIVPFHLTINLGILAQGEYKLKSAFNKVTDLTVGPATISAVDQFVYAQVGFVETYPENNHITLHAFSPSDCLEFSETKFIMNDNQDTLAVLPIMKKVKAFCPQKMVPFKVEIDLTEEQAKSNLLLHVRSMDGKSVNTIFHPEVD